MIKNCRDCLHFKACYEMAAANNADEFNTMFAENCEDFSDRSEWVHLPFDCKDTPNMKYGRWEQCFEDFRKQIEGDKCSACVTEFQ